MTSSEVLKVLTDLANGLHPVTGQPLTRQDAFNEPIVVRALFSAIRQIETGASSTPRLKSLPENAGKAWSPEEDRQLIDEFDAGESPQTMAKIHRRSRGAIRSRLVRLGKLEPHAEWPAPTESEGSESNWERLKRDRSQAGKIWTAAEDEALLRDYDAGVPVDQIAMHLHRGIQAVEVRLIKLGRQPASISLSTA